MTSRRALVVLGTRPEAIKLAPVVWALEQSPVFKPIVAVTGQHREMLDQMLQLFQIHPAVDLNIIAPRQSLTDITQKTLGGLADVLHELRPDIMVVQGDTTTTMAAALAAFYARVSVAHVEAGLRTRDRWAPYPEEVNRRITAQLTGLHLAPTSAACANLVQEGVSRSSIIVTGNTVIDTLLWTVDQAANYDDPALATLDASGAPVVLVTAHRRESWGPALERIARAVAEVATRFPDVRIVLPMHRNPVVRQTLIPVLGQFSNVVLTEPLPYGVFARLMSRSRILLTDSGGIQEEGPSLGKPVLVMRDVTERPEAVAVGAAKLVGTDVDNIVSAVSTLLCDDASYAKMASAGNPYGDGRAAWRVERAIANFLGLTDEVPPEFDPAMGVADR